MLTFEDAEKRIPEIINEPGPCSAYRSVRHSLRMEGIVIPRAVVQAMVKEIDPDGAAVGKK